MKLVHHPLSCVINKRFNTLKKNNNKDLLCSTGNFTQHFVMAHVGSVSLAQWIFPIQELNWGILHCRWILYQLETIREATSMGKESKKE